MAEGSAYKLSVDIAIIDKFSGGLKSFGKQLEYSKAQADLAVKSLRAVGGTSAEVKNLKSSLDGLAQSTAMSKLADDMKKAGMTVPQIQKVASGMGAVADAHEKMQKAQKVALVGAGVTAVGGGLAYGLAKAAEQASKFQTAMTGAAASMKLTNQQATQMSNMAMNLGIPTRFSAVETSQIMNAMHTAGLTNAQVLNSSLAKEYINFADVQAYRKNEDPQQAVGKAIGMTHMYGIYNTNQLNPFLNQLNSVLMNTGDTISEFATTFKYVATQGKQQGMSSQDALAATAWLGRMGMGTGRGGTNLADFIRLSVLGAGSSAATQAMYQSGLVTGGQYIPAHYQAYTTATGKTGYKSIAGKWTGGHSVFTDAKGNFVGIPQAVSIMQDLYKRYGGNMNELTPILHTIWGTQGGRVAQLMMSSGASTQYKMVQQQMAHSGSIDTIQNAYNKTLAGQARQFKTTIEDIVTQFGLHLIPVLNKLLLSINPLLSAFLKFEQNHPQMVKLAAVMATIAAATLLVVGPLIMLAGAIGMISISLGKGGALRAGLSIMSSPFTKSFGAYSKAEGAVGRGVIGIGSKIGQGAISIGTSAITNAKALGAALKSMSVSAAEATVSFVRMSAAAAVSGARMAVMAVRTTAVKVAEIAVSAATKAWEGIQIVLDAILTANPIGIIIVAIGALIAAIVLLITHWKNVINWLKQAWEWYDKLGTKVQMAIAIFAPFIGLPALIIAHWQPIAAFFDNIGKHISGALSAAGNFASHLLGIGGGSSTPITPSSSSTVNIGAIHVTSSDPTTAGKSVLSALGNHAAFSNWSSPTLATKMHP